MTSFERFKKDYQGKRVLVMGLGLLGGGVGVARFFSEIGAQVTVTDLKNKTELKPSLKKIKDLKVKLVLGRHEEKDFISHDLIIRNPAVPQSSPFLALARKKGVAVSMDTSLFAKFCSAPIIGVTGTRGKTTTATLIYELLQGSGKQTLLGGNVQGMAALSLLKKVRENSLVVLELSSWELQGFNQEKISPQIAVITNVYPDHLNRYQNMDKYIADKKVIFKYQTKRDFLVLNQENEETKKMADQTKSQVIWFKKADLPKEWHLRLPGGHNLANAAAAYQVGRILKLYPQWMEPVFKTFKGVSGRLEKIAKIRDVKYINDTTSTTPEAVMSALDSFNNPIILIAGGADKNLSFDQLGAAISKKAKAVLLLKGTAIDKLTSSINESGGKKKILGCFDDLKKAVKAAQKKARPGEIILLSPGCASFGMFNNEYHRGDVFNQIVKELNDAEKK